MNLARAADLFELDIANAKRPSMGAEPEVRIPVSMARVYLEAMQEAQKLIEPPAVPCTCPTGSHSVECLRHGFFRGPAGGALMELGIGVRPIDPDAEPIQTEQREGEIA